MQARRLRFVVGVSAVLTLLAHDGCRTEPGPEATVRRFVQALNDKDMNQFLSCIDPRQERMFRAAFRVVEGVTGLPLNDLFEMFPGINQVLGRQSSEDFWFSNLVTKSRVARGEFAEITISVTSHIRSAGRERTSQEDLLFKLQRFEEAGWRITEVLPLSGGPKE